ncbi:MAG TPA: cupin domain-containing protein [Trebonia sp.]|jgi:quercetin dioxygenase-like cupin family protein|nr:cupin domain-containing protein [Trebonia sp.]
MTARLHRVADALAFQPEGHTGVSPVRLTGTTPDEPVSVVLSSYEPGAQAERSPVALDTVYLVLTGRLTVSLDDDEQVELTRLDSLFLPAGCVRAVDNLTDEPASMLVIRPNP